MFVRNHGDPVSKRELPHPDPMAVRDVLRGARYVLRRLRASIQETLPVAALPRPAAEFADVAMREMRALTTTFDAAVSSLARRVLGGSRPQVPSLHEMAQADDGTEFATSFYDGVDAFLRRLGLQHMLISESAAKRAYLQSMRAAHSSDAALAADLTLRLLREGVLRGEVTDSLTVLSRAELRAVAVFAAVLWLLSERPEAEDRAAMVAAQDLSLGLKGEIASAYAAGDAHALQALYESFASNV